MIIHRLKAKPCRIMTWNISMRVMSTTTVGLLCMGWGVAGAQDFDRKVKEIGEKVSAEAQQARRDAEAAPRATAVAVSEAPGGGIPAVYLSAAAPAKDAIDAAVYCISASLAGDPGFEYCANVSEYRGFTLTNRLSPTINPLGRGVRRSFSFFAPQNGRQDMGLRILDWGTVDEDASDSAWSMLTELVFFPRDVMPSVRLVEAGGAYEVTIPTGEKILFDAKTKEIVGGVLAETSPIDRSENRFTRKFAGLRYDGVGVMVRADQRGESPRSASVWGQKKTAIAVWRGKTCRLSPADIWRQGADGSGGAGLYASDADFYVMLRRKCGWDASAGN